MDTRALRRAMTALLDSAGARPVSRVANLPHGDVHWLEQGAGPALVLLHGAGGGAANWFRVLEPLSRRHRVLAPDLPGFGLSAGVSPRSPLGLQAAELLRDWRREAGLERYHVLGTSFGGLTALRLAQLDPAVEKLVLLDSVGLGRALPRLVRCAALPGARALLLRPTRRGTEWLFRTLLVADPGSIPAEQRKALLDYLWECARIAFAPLAASMHLFSSLAGQREVVSDGELREITNPTLVLWGARDAFVPAADAARAARVLPAGRFHEFRGAGHSPNWERPDEVVESVLEFLGA